MRTFGIVIVVLLLAAWTGAQVGARAWEEGRYEDALAAIDEALAAGGDHRGELLHHRGNCLFRLGRYPEAILAYRRALRQEPSAADSVFNLRLAERRLGIVAAEDRSVSSRATAWFDRLDDRRALGLLLALELASLVVIVVFRRRPLPIVLAMLLFSAFTLAALRYRTTRLEAPGPQAVVLEPRARLLPEPDEGLGALADLPPGTLVEVEQASDRWLRVRCGQRRGYLPRALAGLVD